MDTSEILTRFKSGTLAREQAVTLLTGRPGAPAGEPPAGEPPAGPPPADAAPAHDTRPPTAPVPQPRRPVPDAYAITALHGWFPHADDLDAYWRLALTGDGERRAAPLPDADRFDAPFFGIAPDTAPRLAPQERALLETVWRALEGAGYVGARLDALTTADGEPRSVGVFLAHGHLGAADDTAATARCGGALPGRLSALLDLRGPSHCVDNGAPSFLTALHLATTALRTGDCAAALVAAVDAVPVACAGAVLVRPLAAARAAGDTVHAVVRGAAVAHAGRAAPGDTDARLTRRARTAAGLAPTDPTDAAVCETRDGAGDAGAATGFAALGRAVLQLGHGTLLPAPGRAAAVAWPRPRDPQGHPLPRRASVAVRGEHGAAAHVLLEEPPEHHPRTLDTVTTLSPEPHLILLSAPTPLHLAATARRLADRLSAPGDPAAALPALADLARELRIGRAALPCRLALICRTTDEMADRLREFAGTPDGAPGDPAHSADLRGRGADDLLDAELPETASYLAALRRGGHLAALARLWLAGVDVTRGEETHGRPVVPLPGSAMLPGPPGAARPTSDGLAR
ncbi:beta-ketoacyl synthase N-terminal-like domain-containing protein [Streptomyces sp. NPDC102406]|uniref:beta-ketoacyl synthase N-terminal-like domain-containing protein n=1 Tax=Streptomyces sp. NPDC102406 TaxID=3366171 RepID=UPI00381E4268